MIGWTELNTDLVFHKRESLKLTRIEGKKAEMDNMKEKLKKSIYLMGDLEGKKRENEEKK